VLNICSYWSSEYDPNLPALVLGASLKKSRQQQQLAALWYYINYSDNAGVAAVSSDWDPHWYGGPTCKKRLFWILVQSEKV